MSATQASAKLTAAPASPLTARIAAEFATAGSGAAEPQRQRALAALTEVGLPTSRDENWKYVNLRALDKVNFVPPSADARPAIKPSDLPTAVGKSRYVFVDGVLDPALSSPSGQAGVTVTTGVAGAGAANVGGPM